ncbi:MarR family winged helix-turn-helix transcriptional regulator [Aromatoleum petrolei]|uniref:MarR family transcriptional regulator n=1 Tax=Aromatoleum petrolei TaxID=76116 RepID=A0ABX1MGN8_9RHOO|nr:MarR family transcriptional regulator [Aromatoleum petrolei]NMF87112.1 MarR family transcriptional regulator [Aromatoleum petrolei]QTQ34849.1 Transcriptional regulator, MarR family [Aromatoleum petrolei]
MRAKESGPATARAAKGSSNAAANAIEQAPKAKGVDTAAQRRDIRLGYLIHDVSRMRRTVFDQLMKPLGITRAQWWVLAHLSRHDGMAQTQLASMLDVGKASLGSLLDRLEATGFIERRPDATDRRMKRVFLSRSSHQLLEKLVKIESDFNEQILASLTDNDRSELIRMLSSIKESLLTLGSGESADIEIDGE